MGDQQAWNKRQALAARNAWEPRREEIVALYSNGSMSQKQMARRFGISQAAFGKALKRLGIAAKPKVRIGRDNGRYKDGSESRLYRNKVAITHCDTCFAGASLVVHHKNFDHFDDAESNLQVLCRSCHARLHRLAEGRRPSSSVGRAPAS